MRALLLGLFVFTSLSMNSLSYTGTIESEWLLKNNDLYVHIRLDNLIKSFRANCISLVRNDGHHFIGIISKAWTLNTGESYLLLRGINQNLTISFVPRVGSLVEMTYRDDLRCLEFIR